MSSHTGGTDREAQSHEKWSFFAFSNRETGDRVRSWTFSARGGGVEPPVLDRLYWVLPSYPWTKIVTTNRQLPVILTINRERSDGGGGWGVSCLGFLWASASRIFKPWPYFRPKFVFFIICFQTWCGAPNLASFIASIESFGFTLSSFFLYLVWRKRDNTFGAYHSSG